MPTRSEPAPIPVKYRGPLPEPSPRAWAPLLCQRCGRRWSGLLARMCAKGGGWEVFCEPCVDRAGLL